MGIEKEDLALSMALAICSKDFGRLEELLGACRPQERHLALAVGASPSFGLRPADQSRVRSRRAKLQGAVHKAQSGACSGGVFGEMGAGGARQA